jgi:hypothetical protein
MSTRQPKARLTLQQHQDALNYAFDVHARPSDPLEQTKVFLACCALMDSAEMVSYLRARIAELESHLEELQHTQKVERDAALLMVHEANRERDAAKAEAEKYRAAALRAGKGVQDAE